MYSPLGNGYLTLRFDVDTPHITVDLPNISYEISDRLAVALANLQYEAEIAVKAASEYNYDEHIYSLEVSRNLTRQLFDELLQIVDGDSRHNARWAFDALSQEMLVSPPSDCWRSDRDNDIACLMEINGTDEENDSGSNEEFKSFISDLDSEEQIRFQIGIGAAGLLISDAGGLVFERRDDESLVIPNIQFARFTTDPDLECSQVPLEPLLGYCSSVYVAHPTLGEGFFTAKHCVANWTADLPVEAYAVLDFYEIQDSEFIDGGWTSRSFAVLDTSKIYLDPDDDIAFLTIAELIGPRVSPVSLATGQSVTVGDLIYSVGHPQQRVKTVVALEDTRVEVISSDFIGSFMDNFNHSSGSPVFNLSGEVIGLVSNQPAALDYTKFNSELQCYLETITPRDNARLLFIVRTDRFNWQ